MVANVAARQERTVGCHPSCGHWTPNDWLKSTCLNSWSVWTVKTIQFSDDIISCRPYHLNFLIEPIVVIFGLNVPKCAATNIVWTILIHDSVPPSFHSRVVCWQFLTHTAQAPDLSPTINGPKVPGQTDVTANNVLLAKIEGPVWYTMNHHLPVVKGANKTLY